MFWLKWEGGSPSFKIENRISGLPSIFRIGQKVGNVLKKRLELITFHGVCNCERMATKMMFFFGFSLVFY